MGNIEKFDSMAIYYDTDDRIKISQIIANTIRGHIANGKEKTAIDYGCGTGLIGFDLLDDFESIIFIDASQNMVDQVKQKIEKAHKKNAHALFCDLEFERPSDLRADYIIVAQTLLHIKDIGLVLSRLYDVLNKGGHLLIVDFDKNDNIVSDEVHNGFEQKELINTTEKLGFKNVKAKTFYHGEKMFMNKDASLFILDCEK